jgi:hypothetical protein
MRTVGAWFYAALAVLAMTSLAASAQAATALEPGVHVDPGSPAAKEYALPLNQARQTGSETGSKANSESTLFGAGIKPPSSPGSPPRAGAAPGQSPSRSGGASSSSQADSQARLADAALRAAREQQSTGGDGSLLALIGGGVAILVLAGFGGTVLRHSRRPTPSA